MTLLVEDKELREAYRRGERPALAKIYDEYARSVFSFLIKGFSFPSGKGRYCFKGYRDSWQLENAVQEVFARAFSQQARLAYDGLRPFRNYLFTIARNSVIDNKRKSAKEFMVYDEMIEKKDDQMTTAGIHPISDPEKAMEEAQLERDVTQFIALLSVKERVVFEVRFREGRSIEVAAAQLEVTEHWIKKEERKIKKRFFNWMRGRGYFEGFRYGQKSAQTSILVALSVLALNGV